MKNSRLTRTLGVLALGAALVATGYGIARVRAEGAPASQPLWYAGTVSDAKRQPLTGNHKVSVRLFEETVDNAACVVGPVDAAFAEGRFRIDVSSCAETLARHPDLWLELSVDDETKPFKRSKIGAVPFAMEAQHAVVASDASGALAAWQESVEARMSQRISTECTYNAQYAYTDCLCNPGEVALTGGGYSSHILRESRPVVVDGKSAWRVACMNREFAHVACNAPVVTCVRVQ